MKPLYFFSACMLAFLILVPLGAPMEAVGVGVLLAAVFSVIRTKPKGMPFVKLKR
jgi:hypothetical protein